MNTWKISMLAVLAMTAFSQLHAADAVLPPPVPVTKPAPVVPSKIVDKDNEREMTKEQFKERNEDGVYIREEKVGDDIIIHHDDGQKKVCPYYDPNSANSGPASDIGKPASE